MDDQYDCFSRQVIIGREGEVEKGSVHLPSEFYEHTGIRPGHQVVLQAGDKHLKVKARAGDLLKRDEVMVSPGMATQMGLADGDIICVEDKVTFTERIFDELEDAVEAVEERVDRGRDRVFVEGAEKRAERREKALDTLIPSRTEEPPPKAIEVEPDLSHIGESTEEEPVMDISEQVKVWTPDPEGDGVREFKPGKDDEEEQE
ncbi:MAG: hypothetical protein JSW25_05885 [Thermoplasmata archaeon]|nr:MAG: hypothetical protein JSW25_05885 [Thermoplasmata archaeon]